MDFVFLSDAVAIVVAVDHEVTAVAVEPVPSLSSLSESTPGVLVRTLSRSSETLSASWRSSCRWDINSAFASCRLGSDNVPAAPGLPRGSDPAVAHAVTELPPEAPPPAARTRPSHTR